MTDKEKIRAEIERRIEELQPCNTRENLRAHGAIAGYYQILSFIDSMQEEPKFKTGDRIKPIDSCLGSPRTIVNVCDSWYVTDQGTLDFEYEDNWELVEEPVRDDFEEALAKEWKGYVDRGAATVDALEDNTQELTFAKGFYRGAKWQKESLWKPANGDDLPEYEREVVVFTQNYPDDAGMMMVAIGHRPTPEGYDGRSLTTGKVEHYIPKTYDKGGWNIPDVKYWLDVDLPKEIEL